MGFCYLCRLGLIFLIFTYAIAMLQFQRQKTTLECQGENMAFVCNSLKQPCHLIESQTHSGQGLINKCNAYAVKYFFHRNIECKAWGGTLGIIYFTSFPIQESITCNTVIQALFKQLQWMRIHHHSRQSVPFLNSTQYQKILPEIQPFPYNLVFLFLALTSRIILNKFI